jgi:hypothetical protein
MKITLRSFVLLDVLSLVFLGMQLWVKIENYDYLLTAKLSEKIQAGLVFPMFVLIAAGAIGLFLMRRFGFILYYIQFPFRLYLWIFSVGFITFLPEALGLYEDKYFDILLKVCFVSEFIRLYLTIRMHLTSRNNNI